jgi:UPF0271 protein
MGEGAGNDEAIMPFISAANIACGYHAGDEDTIKKTIGLALKYGVAIGAHPGFADKENFGRLETEMPLPAVYDLVAEQVTLVQKIARGFGTGLHHVKPHGALYNMAAKNKPLAEVIAKAIKDVDDTLIVYGLYNSFLISAAEETGLQTAGEVFADRRYSGQGKLVPRTVHGAVIEEEEDAVKQVLQVVLQNTVTTIEGGNIAVHPQTVCIHGDGKQAAAFAEKINRLLQANCITIQTI